MARPPTANQEELRWGQCDLEVQLRMMSGWGTENLTAACGWIATGMRWRTGKRSTFVIHTGRGSFDNVNAVIDHTVDMAFTTPLAAAAMAVQGRGPFATRQPHLRAIAALPHRDRLLFAVTPRVARRYQLRTVADFVARRPPLRVATLLNDGINVVGYAVAAVLAAYGMAWDDLERWGGRWLVSETPFPALARFADGAADAIFNEAVSLWPKFLGRRQLVYLAQDPAVLATLRRRYGFDAVEIAPGEFPGVEAAVPAVDFSQWVILVRDDMPDEVAYLMTQVIVEDRAEFESRYRHLPLNESALRYPIQPTEICKTAPVPLHAGAERYYVEQGYLARATGSADSAAVRPARAVR